MTHAGMIHDAGSGRAMREREHAPGYTREGRMYGQIEPTTPEQIERERQEILAKQADAARQGAYGPRPVAEGSFGRQERPGFPRLQDRLLEVLRASKSNTSRVRLASERIFGPSEELFSGEGFDPHGVALPSGHLEALATLVSYIEVALPSGHLEALATLVSYIEVEQQDLASRLDRLEGAL